MRYIAYERGPVEPITETERRLVSQLLTRFLDDLDNPGPSRFRVKFQHEERAKVEAKKMGLELLTPSAASKLFGKSPSTIRRAVADGTVHSYALQATARPISLVTLHSATANWSPPKDDRLLDEMRTNGCVIGIGGDIYNILNPKPLIGPYKQGEKRE